MEKDGSYHHKNLREDLISYGRKLIVLEGYANFSLRGLAKEIGVSHTAPYRHFKSKEELVSAIMKDESVKFVRALASSIEGVADPWERLASLGEGYVRFFVDNPETLVLFTILPEQMRMAGQRLSELFKTQAMGDGLKSSGGKVAGPGQYAYDGGFMLLSESARAFNSRYPGLSDKDVIFGFWAKAHGLATLLVAQPDYFSGEDLDGVIKRLMRNSF
jgi:AcrR family transcriptional regulator